MADVNSTDSIDIPLHATALLQSRLMAISDADVPTALR